MQGTLRQPFGQSAPLAGEAFSAARDVFPPPIAKGLPQEPLQAAHPLFFCYINSPRLLKISTQKNTVITENVVVNTTCAPARSSLPPICWAMG